jgi:hypothetical protein
VDQKSRLSLRLGLLMLCLAAVALYASAVVSRRTLRSSWQNTLHVALVTMGPGGVPKDKSNLLEARLPQLSALLTREFARYHPGSHLKPVEFEWLGSVGVEEAPPMSPESGRFLDRGLYAFELARYFGDVNKRGKISFKGYDARIYIMLQPAKATGPRFVEGIGAMNGDIGIVESQLDPSMVDLTLVAVGHEFLHCVGATDKYDEEGHSVLPEGLPETERVPRYPQRFAEIMVGELAQGPKAGRLPATLDEVAVGPATAAEIGWITKD